ncbi:unnamed protein product, partial [Brassica oleracea]
MEFRDWDPGNQLKNEDYGWLRRISSNGIEGSGDAYQSDIGQILVRTTQRWMFMVTRFGSMDTRFRGSHFKESDDGIIWIVRWISFNSRFQESSGIILDRITKGILFFYARTGTNLYGFDWIRIKCEVKILGIIWIQGDNHVFIQHPSSHYGFYIEECSEGEMAEALRELEQASGEENREVEEVTNVEAQKDMADGDVGKKNGSRKRLFKPTISTAASTKMRLAKAFASPRKRTVVFSFAGFVYYRVYGSQENKGLQYEVTFMELCLIVTKTLWLLQVASYDNLLDFIGFCLWYRNSTFVLWMGVRKRVGYLQKAGLPTMFGTNLLVFGMVYWFGYRDEDFRIIFWMRLLCWISLNPTQKVLTMQKMGLCRECRLRLMVLNTVMRRLTL